LAGLCDVVQEEACSASLRVALPTVGSLVAESLEYVDGGAGRRQRKWQGLGLDHAERLDQRTFVMPHLRAIAPSLDSAWPMREIGA